MNLKSIKQSIKKEAKQAERIMKGYDYDGTRFEYQFYKGKVEAFNEILSQLDNIED